MIDPSLTPLEHGLGPASPWVQRWSHLVPPKGTVLDLACGHGRHMKWFAEKGHAVTGIDRSADAVQAATQFGEVILADIENGPWPFLPLASSPSLTAGSRVRQFDAVVITNYLWRPLFAQIAHSVAPSGVLLYETFALGNGSVGKPSNPDFLLRPGELLHAFESLRTIAFEEGFLEDPPRFVQRLVAVRPGLRDAASPMPPRYRL